ncbi:uncharacterized protein [Nicotiana tomentosiformis]|uniref:uncharacterized protein n=1 Tax=Nicotiana tomentosiformis TaxID=4098 RepID=UPI00388CA65A
MMSMDNVLIWNIRSVNTQKAFQRLINLHRKYNFYLIGLIESWQDINKLEVYRRKLGIESAFVNVNGMIWAFIDEDIDVEVLIDMDQELIPKLFHRVVSKGLIGTLVYAKCDVIERIELWDSLYHLASDMMVPWIVGGDFNVILFEEENYVGLLVYISEVEDFSHCKDICALYDLGFKGSLYAWWNGRSDDSCIFKRLDRYLANQQFQDLFPTLEVEHLIKFGYDHAPLVLSCNANTVQVKNSFKILNFWVRSESFLEIVKENWKIDIVGNPFITFQQKLINVKNALAMWCKVTFGNIFKQITALEDIFKVHEVEFELNPTAQNMAKLHKV